MRSIIVLIITITAVIITTIISSPANVEATHDPNYPECWEIGPNSNVNDNGTRYEYIYYYRKQCNYYDSNGRLYQYWYTLTTERLVYRYDNNYYDRDYYSTTQTWTLVNDNPREWVSNGEEVRIETYRSSNGNSRDHFQWIKEWFDSYYWRYYTYLEYSGWYSYSGCCSADWSYISTDSNSRDALCYPYSNVTQSYFVINGFPTGNEDGTYYRSDRFNYNAILELRRNDGMCYFADAYNYLIPYSLQLDSCYNYFSYPELEEKWIKRYGQNGRVYYYLWYEPTNQIINTDICLNADISIRSNAPYGDNNIMVTVDYVYPIIRYWNYQNYCYGSPWGNCAGPDNQSRYDRYNGYNVILATAKVVPYDPKLLVYPFLSITDISPWSFDKQISLAVKYLGSRDTDGNIYPLRRAVINSNTEDSYAYQPWRGYSIPTVDPDSVKESLYIPVEYRLRNTHCDDMYPNVRYSNDSNGYLQQLAVLQSTYFILDIKYTNSSREPSDYILNLQQYQLADLTIKGKLYTRAGTIAGDDLLTDKQVVEYEYTFPTRIFNRVLSLRTVTESNGNLVPINVYKIKVEFIPREGSDYYSLIDYARMKYNYDIALKNGNIPDPDMTELILCSEDANNTYKPKVIEGYNTNHISTMDRFFMLYLPESAKRTFNVNNLLQIPIHYALQALTPMDIKVTVQPYAGSSYEITNIYQTPAYQQYSVYQKDIFLGASVWTDRYVKRYGTQVVIESPTWFRVDRVEVNSQEYGIFITSCNVGCTINVGKGSVSLWVRNEWDAVGYAVYPALDIVVENPNYDTYSLFFLFIAWSVTALTVLYFLRRKISEAF